EGRDWADRSRQQVRLRHALPWPRPMRRPLPRQSSPRGRNAARFVCCRHTCRISQHSACGKSTDAAAQISMLPLSSAWGSRAGGYIGTALVDPKDVDPMNSDAARHVAFFVYPSFVLLDLCGPLETFATAELSAPGSYRLSVMSLEGGEIDSSTHL